MKPIIKSYQEFIKTHRKYSRSPHFNMNRHGYFCVSEGDVYIDDNGKCLRSRDTVQDYINGVGKDSFANYVYYRTVDGWGLPYIFIFVKTGFWYR